MRAQTLSDLAVSKTTVAKKNVFIDLDASFRRNPFTSDIYTKKDIEAVKASIVNIILTGNFERPFQPTFGGNINRYLFENLDDNIIDTMTSVITNIVDLYEPRAKVIGVYVAEDDIENNRLSITIQFRMISTNQVADVTTVLQRVR